MSRWKVHPFIAIMLASIVFGLVSDIPFVDAADGTPGLVNVIGKGFQTIFSSIGIVIILGTLIGAILEETGAALKLSDMVVKLVGKRHPAVSMALMGWIVSIPVFCDSGFVILNPIRKAIARRARTSSVALTVALSAGLYVSHVFIPPTPGPLAGANALGLSDNILLVMGIGALCSVLPLICGIIYAVFIGRRVKADDEVDAADPANAQSYEELLASFGRLPGGFASISPILVPILMMGTSSVLSALHLNGGFIDFVLMLCSPVMAMTVGALCAVLLLAGHCRRSDSDLGGRLTKTMDSTLRTVGPILFITASGGVLGNVVASSDLIPYITSHSDLLRGLGIFFPFLLSALLKTCMGSSTVAIITTAQIVAPLLALLGFSTPVEAALICMAISAGAMTVSHANDSYFWVVTTFGSMDISRGYRTQTLLTLILGLSAILEVWVISLFV